MERSRLSTWIDAYERAWRTPGTDWLAYLFTSDATYSMGPFEETQHGLDAISELWFASEADARTRFYRDEESSRVIAEDVRRFVDLRGGASWAKDGDFRCLKFINDALYQGNFRPDHHQVNLLRLCQLHQSI